METFLLSRSIKTAKGCWEWQGSLDHSRYGLLTYLGRRNRAHRVSWIVFRGPIPEGLWVLHKCDNPQCINPDHLFLGTRQDNTKDMITKGRHAIGATNGQAKLNEEKVREIRKRLLNKDRVGVLAKAYGVDKNAIMAIRDYKTWKHVKEPQS